MCRRHLWAASDPYTKIHADGPCHLLQVYKRPHRTFLNKQKWVPAKINVNPLGMPLAQTSSMDGLY